MTQKETHTVFEADAVGLKLMAKACFDPGEASAQASDFSNSSALLTSTELDLCSRFWVRMEECRRQYAKTGIMAWLEALSRGGVVGDVDLLSTHPANEKRIRV